MTTTTKRYAEKERIQEERSKRSRLIFRNARKIARKRVSPNVQDITVICNEGLYFICTHMTNDDYTSFEEEIVLTIL